MNLSAFKSWVVLLGLQTLVSAALFSVFFSGRFYFAYLDIGSDSYTQVVPYVMYLARSVAREGFPGWSFELGLGGPTTLMFGDLTSLLTQLVGGDDILPARIWVYISKIALGGAFFLFFIRQFVQRWESAVAAALSYSFCGFMVINGQWDIEATAFVFYPLVLLAIVRRLRFDDHFLLPIAIAAALLFGIFFVSMGVFVIYAALVGIMIADNPKIALRTWALNIFPLVALGYLLATPYLVPVIFQLLDSSRVGGEQSLIQGILNQSFGLNSWPLIVAQIGGLFHKDIFGIGSAYQGYWNYLEGPGFFVGVTFLLLISQLYKDPGANRKLIVLAMCGFLAYVLFPVFRYSAMGFAAPYFRISTLWVSMVFLILGAKAFDQVIVEGISPHLLIISLTVWGLLLCVVWFGSTTELRGGIHIMKLCALAACVVTLLLARYYHLLAPEKLPTLLLAMVLIELTAIARPSYIEGRTMVQPSLRGYDDGTQLAIRTIKDIDNGVFRIEKDYTSVSFADSLAQDYMGIRSYSLHSRGVVDFHIGTGLIMPTDRAINFTNWLPNAGSRFILNSLLGVKYFISMAAVDWPGFIEINNPSGLRIYRNDMALPLGVVQTEQINKATYRKLFNYDLAEAGLYRDLAMLNAVVVDELIPRYGNTLNVDKLVGNRSVAFRKSYFAQAQSLQASGLRIETFASNRIVGTISPTQAGILVFSIPFSSGWTLRVDGVVTPMFRANFGMLAAPVSNGHHKITLIFNTPGLDIGRLLGIVGLGLLCVLVILRSGQARCAHQSNQNANRSSTT